MKAQLLVVDDEEFVRATLQAVLRDEGYSVDSVGTGEECLKALEQRDYDAVLLDIWLPGKDGIETLRELKARFPLPFVIMISGHGTIETAVQATKLGAFDFVEKPLSASKVLLVLDHALQQKCLVDENRRLFDLLQHDVLMIGSSVSMRALRQQIGYAAPTEGRILIYGENGTGKELVAKLLHLQSRRGDKPFVEVNCAAIPDELIESELFGTVKGAFTGATETRQGKFALANHGTLFLDEVGDMSLKTQAKVLRVLEEQRFYPVGSNEAVEVDVRVIAATNKRLEEEMQKGNFREDLFFRLNVIPFEVPPLRERREDIQELVDHFMRLFCVRYSRETKELTPSAMEKLVNYEWPGNVRELKNTIERLAIMVPKDQIGVGDLPLSLVTSVAEVPGSGERTNWQRAKEEFEREFILRSLSENEWNISRTAAAIGMERSHLHRKLKTYKIR